jgi:FHS family glucose/mannose:H+ symporter-like MFS transporter
MNIGYILLSYLSLVLLSLIDNGRGAAYPSILTYFNISTDQGALIFSLASVSGLIANVTGRFWVSAFGLVNGTRLAIIFMSLGSYLISYSAKIVSFDTLLVAAFVLGLGLGALGITMNVMVSEGARPGQRRQYLSGLHGVYGVSSFLAPHILALILAMGGKWQYYFLYISYIGIPLLIGTLFVKDLHQETFKNLGRRFDFALKNRLIIGMTFGFYVASEILVSSRLSLYLQRVEGYNAAMAGTNLSLFFIFLMTGRLIVAFKSMSFDSEKMLYFSLVATFISFSFGLFIHPLFLSLCGLTMSYFFPVSMDWLSENFKERNHLMVSSVMVSIGVMLSSIHIVFGQISNLYGVKTAFYLFYVLNLSSLIALYYSSKIVKMIR